MIQQIKSLTALQYDRLVAIRRKIHQHPELGYEETATAALVAAILREFDIAVTTNVARTGVVGILKGNNPDKKCIALRADMDALPILEKNKHDFISLNAGKMHACGHDVHTTNLLGVAMILAELRDEIEGTVKFIFQPSEEKMPSGAAAMIAAGVLQNPKPDYMLGMHVSPELQVGTIGICKGKFMASADEIYIEVVGKGGHAARPQEVNNPLYIAAELLLAYSALNEPETPVLLSFGKMIANGATNVIPENVTMAGTLRCFNEEKRAEVQAAIQTIADTIAQKHHAQIFVNIIKGYPVLYNDEQLTTMVEKELKHFLPGKTMAIPYRMGSEDFAFYSQQLPCCFLRFGTANENPATQHGLHSPYFDVDEKVFLTAVSAMSFLVLQLLNNNK